MSRKSFDNFDEFASDYRRIHNASIVSSGADSDYFSEQKVREVRANESGNQLNILDFGCGDGNSGSSFTQHFPGSTYIGVDVSTESLSIAKARNLPNANFSHFNGMDLPIPSAVFDIVFIACVFHHIRGDLHSRVIGEVKRVLKPGGRLYIFEHNPLNPVTRYIVRNCPFDEDAELLKSSYTAKILKASGFENVQTRYTLFFPRHKIFKRLLRVEGYLRWLPLGGQYYARSLKCSE